MRMKTMRTKKTSTTTRRRMSTTTRTSPRTTTGSPPLSLICSFVIARKKITRHDCPPEEEIAYAP